MGNVFRRRRDAAAAVGALIGLLLCVGGPSAVAGSTVSLSDLEFEQVSGRLFELSVRVEGISAALSSTQIGFFYTEQRTRRHNLIEVATVMPIAVGDWLRPGVRWDTSELNPGLYKLRAVVMDDPGVSAENWEDEDAGTYRYVIVDQEGPGLIWPSEDISLRLKDEILCSMDWDKLDDNLRPNATLQSVWNLGGEDIDPLDVNELVVQGLVILLDEEGNDLPASDPFSVGGRVIGSAIQPKAKAIPSVFGFDLRTFVRAALLDYVEFGDPANPVEDQVKLGTPIPMRMALAFTTPAALNIAESLKTVSVFFPGMTDPQASVPSVFSLYTDLEDFVFPSPDTCSLSDAERVYASSDIPPAASLTSGDRWDTYVVGGDAAGEDDTIFLVDRFGDAAAKYAVLRRAEDGRRTETSIAVTSCPVVGVGSDPTTGTKKPVLFFGAADGFLRGLLDRGASFNTAWQPDQWVENAIEVPTLAGELSPPAVAPRPDPTLSAQDRDQKLTEFVVVGSGTGLHVFRLTFGGAGDSPLYHSYAGYAVRTDIAPFVVSSAASEWLVYFFATKSGESSVKLWGANLTRKAEPRSVLLLLGGDEPSTELVAATRPDGSEDTAYLFFGTKNGRVHAIDANYVSTQQALPDGPTIGGRILGLRAIASTSGTYDLYINAATNRLHHVQATSTGGRFSFGELSTHAPRLSNEREMSASLEVLPQPETSSTPGMIFLPYKDGPMVVLDLSLEDVSESMWVNVWEPVWTSEDEGSADFEPILIPFEFPGNGFMKPVVTRSALGSDVRLLVGSAGGDGRVYAFDLSVGIMTPSAAEAAEEGPDPVSP